jgi:multicomponent Na+:H+ antiporter subunit D
VLTPLAAGLLLPWLRLTGAGKRIYTAGTALINAGLILLLIWGRPGSEGVLFWLAEDLPVFLRLDPLAAIYLALTAVFWVGLTFFSHGYIAADERETRYYAFFLGLAGVLAGLGLAGNIVTFYLFFEWLTFMAFPLICHNGDSEAINGGMTFLIYSVLGAGMVLVGLVLLWGEGPIAAFAPGGAWAGQIPSAGGGRTTAALLLLLFGFGCKAGMYPLHAWLPVAHPVAPAPVSAVLSALLTKAGALGMIRVLYYLAGPAYWRAAWARYLWLTVILATIFLGSMLAFREPLLKKRLAYSSVSQIAYLLFGLALLEPAGFAGAILQLIFHGLAKLILFLCVGVLIRQAGCREVGELKGVGRRMPAVMGCFALAALSLAGVPPLGGFISKWYLIKGALAADIGIFSWLGPVVLLISALLTAGYLLPPVISAFFPGAGVGGTRESFDVAGVTGVGEASGVAETGGAGGDAGVAGAGEAGEGTAVAGAGGQRATPASDWRLTAPLVVLTALSLLLALSPGWLLDYLAALSAALLGD